MKFLDGLCPNSVVPIGNFPRYLTSRFCTVLAIVLGFFAELIRVAHARRANRYGSTNLVAITVIVDSLKKKFF